MSMETDSPVVYHGTSESRFPKNEIQKIITELTAEEKELLRQCNKESLYFRCIPFAMLGIAGTHLATRRGFLKPHPVWGSALSMAGAAFFGWIVGKFSYRTKCEDKFVHLNNSSIGEAVRRKRGYILEKYEKEFHSSKTSEDDITLRDDFTYNYSDSDYNPSTGSLNLDVDKNIQYSGLDDRERPTTDRDHMQASKQSDPVKMFTTYEELRQRNREDYTRMTKPMPSSRSELNIPGAQRARSNVDSSPPRRYNSDFGEGEHRRTDGNTWD